MATDRRALPYADPTGNLAAANVDNEREALREAAAAHVLQALADPKTKHRDVLYLMRAIGPQIAAAA